MNVIKEQNNSTSANRVEYKGITYDSVSDLCLKNGLNYKLVHSRTAKGMSLEEAIETPIQDNSVTYKGTTYTSLRNLCKELGVNYGTVVSRINRDGLSLEEAIEKPALETTLTYKGATYVSLRNLCERLSLNYDMIRQRVAKGMALDQAIEKPALETTLTYKGITYDSIAHIAKAFDIPLSTLSMRLSQYNWSLDQAIETPVRAASKEVVYKGKRYNSKTELAREVNIPVETINSRLAKGMTLEQAIEIPVTKANNFTNPDSDIKKAALALSISDNDREILRDTWQSFNRRCNDPSNKGYNRYGGRGIKVYPDWIKTEDNPDAFSKFLLWVMGPTGIGVRPTDRHSSGHTVYSINRINNDGNYEPGNLEWATSRDQTINSTVSTQVTVGGNNFNSIKEASQHLNINYSTAVTRHNSKEGLTDRPVRLVNNNAVTYKGVTYNSLSVLCKELGLNHNLVYDRYSRQGWNIEDAIEIDKSDYYAINTKNRAQRTPNSSSAERYQSNTGKGEINVAKAAREAGVARSTISDKVYRLGMSVEEAIKDTNYYKPVTYKGVFYDNFKSACSSLGMSYSTGRKHLAKGYTAEEYLSGASSKSENPEYEIDGNNFLNLRKLLRFYGFSTIEKQIDADKAIDYVLKYREDNPVEFTAKGIKFKTKRLAGQIAKAGCYVFAFRSKGESYELVKTPEGGEFDNVIKAINEADLAVTTKLKTALIKSELFSYGFAEAIVIEGETNLYLVNHFDVKINK